MSDLSQIYDILDTRLIEYIKRLDYAPKQIVFFGAGAKTLMPLLRENYPTADFIELGKLADLQELCDTNPQLFIINYTYPLDIHLSELVKILSDEINPLSCIIISCLSHRSDLNLLQSLENAHKEIPNTINNFELEQILQDLSTINSRQIDNHCYDPNDKRLLIDYFIFLLAKEKSLLEDIDGYKRREPRKIYSQNKMYSPNLEISADNKREDFEVKAELETDESEHEAEAKEIEDESAEHEPQEEIEFEQINEGTEKTETTESTEVAENSEVTDATDDESELTEANAEIPDDEIEKQENITESEEAEIAEESDNANEDNEENESEEEREDETEIESTESEKMTTEPSEKKIESTIEKSALENEIEKTDIKEREITESENEELDEERDEIP